MVVNGYSVMALVASLLIYFEPFISHEIVLAVNVDLTYSIFS